MKSAPSTDAKLGVVLSLNHHFFSDWQCWSYMSTSMFWQPQDSRVPHQTYKLGAPHLSLCNYHYILQHFHFSLTDFVYVHTVHCHSAITEPISSVVTYESNFLQSSTSTSPSSALKSSWLGNKQYVFVTVCNWFTHCFTSTAHNHGIIYINQPPKLQTLTLNWVSKMEQGET